MNAREGKVMGLTRREKWLMEKAYLAGQNSLIGDNFDDWLNPPWVLRQNAASYPKHIPTREEEFEFDAPSNWISADEPPEPGHYLIWCPDALPAEYPFQPASWTGKMWTGNHRPTHWTHVEGPED